MAGKKPGAKEPKKDPKKKGDSGKGNPFAKKKCPECGKDYKECKCK